MAIYKNFNSDTTSSPVNLIAKNSLVQGSINSILITNHDNTDSCVVQIHLFDGTNTFVINETNIPAQCSLLLTDGISFDSTVYNLRATTSTTADVTIIVK
jgi:hypothetical protein